MASGYWDGGFSARPFTLRLYVSEYSLSDDDILNNRTRCAWTLRIIRTGNYNSYDAVGNSWAVDVGGVTYSGSWAVDFGAGPGPEVPIGGYFDIASGTAVIGHNADGTKTISVSASANSGGGIMGNASLSGSLALQTVPRATTPTLSSPTIDTGAALTLTLTPASGTFSHRLRWAFQPGTGGTAIDDKIVGFAGGSGSNVGTPEGASDDGTPGNYYSVPAGTKTPTLTIPHAVFAQSVDYATRNVTVTIDTYDGATFIGTKTVVVPVTLAASEKPTLAAITDAEATTSPDVATLIGGYVKGVTTLALALTTPAGIHGSTIVSREIKVAGQTLTANGTTPLPIASSGTVPITATVTDSRGRVSDVTTKNVTVLDWAPPSFATAPVVKRALSGGTDDDNGTYLKVDPADFQASSLIVGGTQKNHIEYRLSYRLFGAGSWTVDGSGWIDPANTPSAIRFTGTALTTFGSALTGNAYELLIEIRDVLATSALSRVIPKAQVLLHLKAALGVGIGARHSGGANPVEIWGRGKQASDGLTLGDILDARDFATNAEMLAGTSTTKVARPSGLPQLLHRRNLIRNGRFRVNQRAAASGTSLGSGVYFLDGWKSGSATNAVTWTGSDAAGRTITIPASKTVIQPIEQADIIAGGYTLLWKGTAPAIAQNAGGGTSPSAADVSGITALAVTLSGAANAEVTLGPGTCEWIALVRGTVTADTPFPDESFGDDLRRCKRYFQAFDIGEVEVDNCYDGVTLSGGEQYIIVPSLLEMRATPTVKNNSNAVPTNSVFLCTYINKTAGGNANLNVAITGATPKRLSGLYSSSYNSGSSLSSVYRRARSAVVIWLDADL